jgi:hypothetical protein
MKINYLFKMKIKNKLSESIKTRDSYLDYLRSEDVLTLDNALCICAEITRLSESIEKLKELPIKYNENDILTYSVQYFSEINF